MNQPIIVVSGLPRSGTSMMMQILEAGGMDLLTDNLRPPDSDNPRGYYELQKVKSIREDASWLPDARGKVVKMVSTLLFDLPVTERYKVILMQRSMDQILASQRTMLVNRGLDEDEIPDGEMRLYFEKHLARVEGWLMDRDRIETLVMDYNRIIADPHSELDPLAPFLDIELDSGRMVATVDPSLRHHGRNR